MTSRLEALRVYRERYGWNVIPLAEKSKQPIRGFDLDAAFDGGFSPHKLDQMLLANPDLNLGLVLGPDLVAVDVDDPSRFEEFNMFTAGFRQRTPSGGLHLVYRQLPIDPLLSTVVPRVDIKTGRGYIVLAPSYAVSNHGGVMKSGSYELLTPLGEITYPTQALVNVLRDYKLDGGVKVGSFTQAEVRAKLEECLKAGKFPAGEHNTLIYQGALVWASDGVPMGVAIATLVGLDRRDDTPQSDRVVEDTVRRAYSTHEQRAREFTDKQKQVEPAYTVDETTDKIVIPAPAKLPPKAKRVVPSMVLENYDSVRDQYANYKPRWLVQDWILERSIMLLVAPPERYKTWLAADLATSVRYGLPFLGKYPATAGNVLVIQQEDDSGALAHRYGLIEDSKTAGLGYETHRTPEGKLSFKFPEYSYETKMFFKTDGTLNFSRLETLVQLAIAMELIKPSLVIVDPLYSLTDTGDDFFATLAADMREHVNPLREKYKCAFLFVHHAKKGSEAAELNREASHGSQFLSAASHGMIMLGKAKGDQDNEVNAVRFFKSASRRNIRPVKLTFKIDDTLPDPAQRYSVDVADITKDERAEQVKEYLEEHGASKLADIHAALGHLFGNQKSALVKFLAECDGVGKQSTGIYTVTAVKK